MIRKKEVHPRREKIKESNQGIQASPNYGYKEATKAKSVKAEMMHEDSQKAIHQKLEDKVARKEKKIEHSKGKRKAQAKAHSKAFKK